MLDFIDAKEDNYPHSTIGFHLNGLLAQMNGLYLGLNIPLAIVSHLQPSWPFLWVIMTCLPARPIYAMPLILKII